MHALESVGGIPTLTAVPNIWDMAPDRAKKPISPLSDELASQRKLLSEITPHFKGRGISGRLRWIIPVGKSHSSRNKAIREFYKLMGRKMPSGYELPECPNANHRGYFSKLLWSQG